MTVLLSLQPQVITDSSGLPTRDFRNWQLAVTNAVNAPPEAPPVTPVPPVSGDYLPLSTFVRGMDGIAWTGTLEMGGVLLGLETVADSGVGALLGITRDSFGRVTGTTNATITGTAGQITVVDGDAVAGPPTLSLADVTDAGGGSLLLTTFDTKGRQTGSSAATAADVPIVDAGSYFTGTDVEAALQELGAGGGGGGSGAMTLLGTATVAGSAATTLTLSGLNLGASKSFVVDFALDNATASVASISLYYNSDTTATNYYRQSLFNGGTTNSTSRGNESVVIVLAASETATGSFKIIKDRDGKPRAWGQVNSAAPASIEQRVFSHAWTSATNVTGITLSSSVANSIAIGSTFHVYGIG